MTKNSGNKKQTKSQRREELERKRDGRVRRNAIKKERKAKEYLEDDDTFVSFSNQLEALSLKIKDIPGDGNCLFRSLGDQIDGDHTSHARHRRETVKYMRDHRDDFEPFMEDNITFDQHLQDLSKLGTYGGNDSIVAFARNHGVNIVIHQLNEPRWVINGGDYCKNGGQIRELHISYHNGEHYSSIRHISDNTSEPAWAKINQAIFTSVLMSTEVQCSENRKEKKTNGKGKSKQAITSSTDKGIDRTLQESNLMAAEELVSTATGCKDLVVIKQALMDNMYNVDAAIHYILQLIYVAEETGHRLSQDLVSTSNKLSTEQIQAELKSSCDATCDIIETNRHCENRDGTCKTCVNCFNDNERHGQQREGSVTHSHAQQTEGFQDFIEDLKGTLSLSTQKTNQNYEHQGARPKVKSRTENSKESGIAQNLSNKKRKELAKQEKKNRREERRKDNASSHIDSDSATTQKQHTASAVVPDLGILAI